MKKIYTKPEVAVMEIHGVEKFMDGSVQLSSQSADSDVSQDTKGDNDWDIW